MLELEDSLLWVAKCVVEVSTEIAMLPQNATLASGLFRYVHVALAYKNGFSAYTRSITSSLATNCCLNRSL
jgi:hypothetical protein